MATGHHSKANSCRNPGFSRSTKSCKSCSGRRISSPYPAEAILLDFQHYLVLLGTIFIIPTALVPQGGGGNDEKARVVQTLLFVAGINTLLQTFFGIRLPMKFLHIMRGTQGSLIEASTLQMITGFSCLWHNVNRFLSPLSTVHVVALAGFGLLELGFLVPVQTLVVAIMASITLGGEFYLGGIIGAVLVVIGLYLVLWGKSEEKSIAARATRHLPYPVDEHDAIRTPAAVAFKASSLNQPLLPPSVSDSV